MAKKKQTTAAAKVSDYGILLSPVITEKSAVIPIRQADPAYLRHVRPALRKEARLRDDSVLALLDVVVVSRRMHSAV